MELAKAIELLDDLHKIPDTQLDPDYLDAIKLGIEAMIFLKALRDNYKPKGFKLLPGETPSDVYSSPITLFSLGY